MAGESAALLRTEETVVRKSKICRRYQPHLDFTKPPKLGHLGARSLENDSLALYYLSENFILLLSSPSSFTLLRLCYPPPSFLPPPPPPNVPPGAVVGGWDGEKMKAGRPGAAAERFHLLSAGLCCIRGGDAASGCSDTAEQR